MDNIREGQKEWSPKIIARDKCCQLCDEKENLEAHHKDGNPENNSLDNGVALCHNCNMKMERILTNPQKFLPSELTFVGIHRSLAHLKRTDKRMWETFTQRPLDLMTVQRMLSEISGSISKIAGEKSTSEDMFHTAVFLAGMSVGNLFLADCMGEWFKSPHYLNIPLSTQLADDIKQYYDAFADDSKARLRWITKNEDVIIQQLSKALYP